MKYALTILLYALFSSFCIADSTVALRCLRATAMHLDAGSGSVVEAPSGKHYLLTNDHVCRFGSFKDEVLGRLPEGPSIKGPIVKRDAIKDLCAIAIPKQESSLRIGKKEHLYQKVYTRGFPEHILTESSGIIGGKGDWEYEFPIAEIGECPKEFHKVYNPLENILVGCRAKFHSVYTNLYGRPGSSGSAVVNDNGELIGVISNWAPQNEYDAGMVSLDDIKQFMKGL